MISTTTLKLLLDAGQSNEWLLAVTAAFEADVNTVRELLREQFRTVDAGEPTPAALRMRKIRENKRLLKEQEALNENGTVANTVREPCVTSYNILSLSKGIEKEESKPVVIARGRKQYPELFEKFWKAYPTDGGMSKKEAFKPWQKMTEPERELAIAAIPAFKRWAEKQGDSYRVVHACRYLSQGRFEGFSDQAAKMAERASATVYVKYGTDAGDAWEQHYKTVRNKIAPRDQNGGWYFPAEYPPTQNEQAA